MIVLSVFDKMHVMKDDSMRYEFEDNHKTDEQKQCNYMKKNLFFYSLYGCCVAWLYFM